MPSVRFEDLPPEVQAQIASRTGEPLLPPITKESLAWQHKAPRKPRATRSRKRPTRKAYSEGPVVHRGPRPKPEFELHGGHIWLAIVVILFLLSTICW